MFFLRAPGGATTDLGFGISSPSIISDSLFSFLKNKCESSLCEGSNSAVSMDLSETVVENGETEMSPEESWEHKEAEPAGGSSGDGRPP